MYKQSQIRPFSSFPPNSLPRASPKSDETDSKSSTESSPEHNTRTKVEISPCFERREGDLKTRVRGEEEEVEKATTSRRRPSTVHHTRLRHLGKQTRPPTAGLWGAATRRRGRRRSPRLRHHRRVGRGRSTTLESRHHLPPRRHHPPPRARDEERSGGVERAARGLRASEGEQTVVARQWYKQGDRNFTWRVSPWEPKAAN